MNTYSGYPENNGISQPTGNVRPQPEAVVPFPSHRSHSSFKRKNPLGIILPVLMFVVLGGALYFSMTAGNKSTETRSKAANTTMCGKACITDFDCVTGFNMQCQTVEGGNPAKQCRMVACPDDAACSCQDVISRPNTCSNGSASALTLAYNGTTTITATNSQPARSALIHLYNMDNGNKPICVGEDDPSQAAYCANGGHMLSYSLDLGTDGKTMSKTFNFMDFAKFDKSTGMTAQHVAFHAYFLMDGGATSSCEGPSGQPGCCNTDAEHINLILDKYGMDLVRPWTCSGGTLSSSNLDYGGSVTLTATSTEPADFAQVRVYNTDNSTKPVCIGETVTADAQYCPNGGHQMVVDATLSADKKSMTKAFPFTELAVFDKSTGKTLQHASFNAYFTYAGGKATSACTPPSGQTGCCSTDTLKVNLNLAPYTDGYIRPRTCSDGSITPGTLEFNTPITFKANSTQPAENATIRVYNRDNKSGQDSVCVGDDAADQAASCPKGGHMLVFNVPLSGDKKTLSTTLSYGDLAQYDKSMGGIPKNLSFNLYFNYPDAGGQHVVSAPDSVPGTGACAGIPLAGLPVAEVPQDTKDYDKSACGRTCSYDYECGTRMLCTYATGSSGGKVCRSHACPSDTACSCSGTLFRPSTCYQADFNTRSLSSGQTGVLTMKSTAPARSAVVRVYNSDTGNSGVCVGETIPDQTTNCPNGGHQLVLDVPVAADGMSATRTFNFSDFAVVDKTTGAPVQNLYFHAYFNYTAATSSCTPPNGQASCCATDPLKFTLVGNTGTPASVTSTPTPTPTRAPLGAADINQDGAVDVIDYAILYSNWGRPSDEYGALLNPRANIDGIGVVDTLDYSIWYEYFGR